MDVTGTSVPISKKIQIQESSTLHPGAFRSLFHFRAESFRTLLYAASNGQQVAMAFAAACFMRCVQGETV